MRLQITVKALLFVMLMAAGCASERDAASQGDLTVTGRVSMRGHEPFSALVLETDDRNVYVLTLSGEQQRSAMLPKTPGRFRVTGALYEDNWNGKPYAHLRVASWETLPHDPGNASDT